MESKGEGFHVPDPDLVFNRKITTTKPVFQKHPSEGSVEGGRDQSRHYLEGSQGILDEM